VVAVLVTAMRFKLGHYVTPVFPFLALISAYSLHKVATKHRERLFAGTTVLATVLMAALLVFPIHLGPEAFGALRRFMPYIQTHGSCDDVVALIPGGEPAGSAQDYSLVLNFYTSRPVEVLNCETLRQRIHSGSPPPWVILGHENLEACFPVAARAAYPTALLSGSQYLFTTRIPRSAIADLTPLDLEQAAVTDCKAPPYPRDMWHKYLPAEAASR
jgi:hypothetical protein